MGEGANSCLWIDKKTKEVKKKQASPATPPGKQKGGSGKLVLFF